MSVPSFRAGTPAVAGFKFHQESWDTQDGAALGSGDGFEILMAGTAKPIIEPSLNQSATGGVGIQKYPVLAHYSVENGWRQIIGYATIARVLAGVWGADAVTDLTAGAYRHYITWALANQGIGSFAYTDYLVCHDFGNSKLQGVTLSWEEGNIGEMDVALVARRELTDDSGANTFASVNASCTLPTQPAIKYQQLHASQCAVRINAASGGALSSSDLVYPNRLTISAQRNYKTRRTTKGLPYVDEPVDGSWAELKITMGFPIDTVSTWYNMMTAMTEAKMDITFTGSLISGSNYWLTKLEVPSIMFASDGLPNLDDPDVLEFELQGTCFLAAAAPTGMSGVTAPRWTIVDTISGSHLNNGV